MRAVLRWVVCIADKWALLASGQIVMRKVDGWRTLATKVGDGPIDLAG